MLSHGQLIGTDLGLGATRHEDLIMKMAFKGRIALRARFSGSSWTDNAHMSYLNEEYCSCSWTRSHYCYRCLLRGGVRSWSFDR